MSKNLETINIKSYKDLIVWQKSVNLSLLIYNLTAKFPKEEIFGLVSQMRRSAVSIASNIAEGRQRGTRKDFAQFLRVASGSAGELATQIEISEKISFGKNLDYNEIRRLLEEIQKMLHSLIFKLKANT